MARKDIRVRKRSLYDEDNPLLDHAALTMAQRVALVWELTVQAWTLQGRTDAEPRFSRDLIHVLRRRG